MKENGYNIGRQSDFECFVIEEKITEYYRILEERVISNVFELVQQQKIENSRKIETKFAETLKVLQAKLWRISKF